MYIYHDIYITYSMTIEMSQTEECCNILFPPRVRFLTEQHDASYKFSDNSS